MSLKRIFVITIVVILLIPISLLAAIMIAPRTVFNSPECHTMNFEILRGSKVTSIYFDNVLDYNAANHPMHIIVDREVIERTTAYFLNKTDNWYVPWYGPPAGQLRVVFWSGDERIATVNVGRGFLEGQGCGGFFSRDISEAEQAAFFQIVGISFDFGSHTGQVDLRPAS